jgi:hypothetical protein
VSSDAHARVHVELEVHLADGVAALERLVGVLRRKGANITGLRYASRDRGAVAVVDAGLPVARERHIVDFLQREVLVVAARSERIPALTSNGPLAPPDTCEGWIEHE